MRPLHSAVLAVHSLPRERIFGVMLAEPERSWSVRDLAALLPDVSVEAVRTTVYLLMGEKCLDTLPGHRGLTVRLNADGRLTVEQITVSWAAPRRVQRDEL